MRLRPGRKKLNSSHGHMRKTAIIAALRPPTGQYGGLASVRPDDLAAHLMCATVHRTDIDPALFDDIYLFGAIEAMNQPGEDNRSVARMAALLAGVPDP